MTWNQKYWDIISSLYWTPRFLGFQPIRSGPDADSDHVLIPKPQIMKGGSIYVRARRIGDLQSHLSTQEEILNHLFNITFAIASDDVVSQLLCKPLNISDSGPFESIGQEIHARYGWRENVTQPDGLFATSTSLIGVELKLKSSSWPEQIAKYAAVMVWEEERAKKTLNLGLLFVVPEDTRDRLWRNAGLSSGKVDDGFLARLSRPKLPSRVKKLIDEKPNQCANVLSRLKLQAVSWTWLRNEIAKIESELDRSNRGDQTLGRLLAGFRAQIEQHKHTGLI